MLVRRLIPRSLVSAALAASALVAIPLAPGAAPVSAAPAGDDQVVAFIVQGVGNGHGRGMSQWGAFGRAVNGGQSWTQILDTYYGGTTGGAVAAGERAMSVRLTPWDDATTIGVVDGSGNVRVNGAPTNFAAVRVTETAQNVFQYSGAAAACPSDAGVTWTPIATVTGPIVLSTAADETTASVNSLLGLCTGSGSLVQYRGTIEMRDALGSNRVVNRLDIDNYLRGVIPREVSASWGSAGGGAGMNALMAQSVAARSYAISQNRYTIGGSVYAKTCDTSSCQVYGGAGTKPTASSAGAITGEHALTDQAITATGSTPNAVRRRNGAIVSTEFSASNGPRTAGGSFPSLDDPWDDVPGNPLHRWTRIIDADWIADWCGTANANAIASVVDPNSTFDGVWRNRLTGCPRGASILSLRNALDFPSHGFDLVPVRRSVTSTASFAFIGDSVGVSVAGEETSTLRVLLDGVYPSTRFDALGARPTQGGANDGVAAANAVPVGTDFVVVQLGYNDSPSAMAARIDAVMNALTARTVGRVAWVTVSERRTSTDYARTNAAIFAATSRWGNLTVFDWESASDDAPGARWFTDGVHLSSTGRAEFALFLRDQMLGLGGRPLAPGLPLRVPVLGQFGVPDDGSVVGVALNVTAVNPAGAGWLRVWPCGSPEPDTSSVNYTAAGSVEPNAVLVPVDSTGEVCIQTMTRSEVLVDVSGWFNAGLRGASGRLVDTRDDGPVRSVVPGAPVRVPVLGRFGVPADGTAVGVALNVTAVNPAGAGWLRVWSCDEAEPETSSVNYMRAGAVEPNAVVVPVGPSGEVCVSTMTSTEVLVDVSGWFDAGLRGASGRLVDTRDDGPVRSVVAGAPLRVPVLGRSGVPADGTAVGVALTVTAVNPAGPGWLRVWPCDQVEPETSSVNYTAAGAVEPNAVVVPVGSSGEVCVSTMTSTEVLVDMSGWFDAGLRGASGRLVDTRIALGPIPAR